MKKTYLIAVALLLSTSLYPQMKEELRIIDSARLLCAYRQTVIVYNPETKTKNTEGYTTVLQIGHSMSKYCDYKDMAIDSITWVESRKPGITREEFTKKTFAYIQPLYINKWKDIIYKNLPEKQITTKTTIAGLPYIYMEAYEKPVWTLSKDTTRLEGFRCKMATTTFRGRNYKVWYTTEIPVSDGPWKFCGLPGLIMSIKDDKGEVSFVCQSVVRPKEKKYIFKNKDGHMCITLRNKKEYNDLYKKYMDNPGAAIMASGLIESKLPERAYRKKYYNPIELSE